MAQAAGADGLQPLQRHLAEAPLGRVQQEANPSSDTTSNTNSTTTPNVPDWIAQPAQSMAGNINGLLAQGPAPYTPGTSALQQQANTNAGALTTSPYYTGKRRTRWEMLGNISADQVTGQSVLDNLSSWPQPVQGSGAQPGAERLRSASRDDASRSGGGCGEKSGLPGVALRPPGGANHV